MRVSLLPALRLLLLGIATLSLLPACHTTGSKKPKRDPHAPQTFNERTAGRKGEINKVSQFDKTLSSTSLGDRGAMKSMGRKSYSSSAYKGSAGEFSGMKDYQAKDFAQSSKGNRAQSQLSTMGSKADREAGRSFATNKSRWSGKAAARGNDKTYVGSGQHYQTAEFGEGKKAIEKDKRPYFLPGEVDKSKAYAEEDVKRLLNRN
ncbi:MAG: hypothetical protein JWO89_83 [Verrucomicrobiaceae bacterium]|nr:hypothetical protein [Verrucomicrobiaceae bacterium]